MRLILICRLQTAGTEASLWHRHTLQNPRSERRGKNRQQLKLSGFFSASRGRRTCSTEKNKAGASLMANTDTTTSLASSVTPVDSGQL